MERSYVYDGKYSPWGKIDHGYKYGEGIYAVGTPGHGGMKLDRKRNSMVPKHMRVSGGWYEEDCEWAKVVIAFPSNFSLKIAKDAVRTMRRWFPEEWKEFRK